jgi:hypothetical protein
LTAFSVNELALVVALPVRSSLENSVLSSTREE